MFTRPKFQNLLEPAYIGSVKTRNRMIKTAAGMRNTREGQGRITENDLSFYEALAKGGVGLIIVGHADVDYPLGMRHNYSIHISDNNISGFKELVQVIHKHNCPTFLQIQHAGPSYRDSEFSAGLQPVSASSLTQDEMRERGLDAPRELTIEEIEELTGKFVKAAELAHYACFDGIEINAGTDHLLNSFLSRAWNKRQDSYGCNDLGSRCRFSVEIVQAIKNKLGKEFPVCLLINGAEFGIENGITLEESKGIARILQEAGADAIQVRANGLGDYYDINRPEGVFFPEPPEQLADELDGSHHGAGAFALMAEAIKKVIDIPVLTVGRLDPMLGERILQTNKADFIAMTRRLIADPELPNKVAGGRLDDIAPCMACTFCSGMTPEREPVQCRINARIGNENQYLIQPAEKKKKVVVVGAGPAGMEAARVVALRGHHVILYEKSRVLGGLLPLASMIKGFEIEDLRFLVRYLKNQITKLGVEIRLGKEFTPSTIEQTRPDVVILATGGIPALPEIPGVHNRNVVSGADMYKMLKPFLSILGPRAVRWLTKIWMPVGKNVVIIGGAIQGCELAEFLVKRGRNVTIVETAKDLGEGIAIRRKKQLIKWFVKKNVSMFTQVKYDEITDRGLIITDKYGKKQSIEADTIIPAIPLITNTQLVNSLEGKVPEIYAIGDCNEPRLIADAISDGFKTAFGIH